MTAVSQPETRPIETEVTQSKSRSAARQQSRIALTSPNRTFEQTIPHALMAIEQIGALRAPADPPSFHLWYTYATRALPQLNQTIDELLLGGNADIALDEFDRLYDRYLSTSAVAGQIEDISVEIKTEVSQLAADLDAAWGLGTDCATELSTAAEQLGNSDSREGLGDLVERFVRVARKMDEQNQSMQNSLASFISEIGQLQAKLALICQEDLTDPLTSLADRRKFNREMGFAVAEARHPGQLLSLLMCDIDNFKKFNDSYGHVVGDQVLRLIASTIKRAVSGQDTAARYGGEEFAVILPDTALQQAAVVAEGIRKAIVGRKVVRRSTGDVSGQITISIGVARYKPGDSVQTLTERADACLYAAKHCGRNRVVTEVGNVTLRDADD